MRSKRCTNCQNREHTQHLNAGICRDCRGVEKPKRVHSSVSPDQAEANPEGVDLAEAASRARVIQNDRIQNNECR